MSSPPVKVGVQLLLEHHKDYRNLRHAVDQLEELGVDSLYCSDHFVPTSGCAEGGTFESWSVLGAWAEQTKVPELGVLVSGVGYRNPDLLADMARTLDHVSGGRIVLGLGAGWHEADYKLYGFHYGTAGDRIGQLTTALSRISSRMDQLEPPPIRRIPILLGGGGLAKPASLLARYADRYVSFGNPRQAERERSEVLEALPRVGREPGSLTFAVGVTPDQFDIRNEYRSAGCSTVIIRLSANTLRHHNIASWVRWRDSLNW